MHPSELGQAAVEQYVTTDYRVIHPTQSTLETHFVPTPQRQASTVYPAHMNMRGGELNDSRELVSYNRGLLLKQQTTSNGSIGHLVLSISGVCINGILLDIEIGVLFYLMIESSVLRTVACRTSVASRMISSWPLNRVAPSLPWDILRESYPGKRH